MFFLLICRRRRPLAELRGRGRRDARAPTTAFGRLLALNFRAGVGALSIGAWLPAPRRIMAAQCAEPPDVACWLAGGSPSRRAEVRRAPRVADATDARFGTMLAFGRLLTLNSGLGVGALYPLARGCRRRAGSWPLSAPSRRMFFFCCICRRRRPLAEPRGRGRRARDTTTAFGRLLASRFRAGVGAYLARGCRRRAGSWPSVGAEPPHFCSFAGCWPRGRQVASAPAS